MCIVYCKLITIVPRTDQRGWGVDTFLNLTVLYPEYITLMFLSFLLHFKLECGPMPNVMAALPNTGGALCSTPQSLADAHCYSAVQ